MSALSREARRLSRRGCPMRHRGEYCRRSCYRCPEAVMVPQGPEAVICRRSKCCCYCPTAVLLQAPCSTRARGSSCCKVPEAVML